MEPLRPPGFHPKSSQSIRPHPGPIPGFHSVWSQAIPIWRRLNRFSDPRPSAFICAKNRSPDHPINWSPDS